MIYSTPQHIMYHTTSEQYVYLVVQIETEMKLTLLKNEKQHKLK